MVMVTSALLPNENGNMDIKKWLMNVEQRFTQTEIIPIREACTLVQNNYDNLQTPAKLNYINHGLEIANLLLSLKLDHESIVASILYPVLQYSDLTISDITEQFSKNITKLLKGALQMDTFSNLQSNITTTNHIDNYRRMLLAMVDDVRVVLLKLAERTVILRHPEVLPIQQQYLSQQAMDIYAPLANRLGILELKWELEDLAFHVLQPEDYKTLAKQLNERRIDREQFITTFMQRLDKMLQHANVQTTITGRAKHIYSIYRKMRRKDVTYDEIYDAMALRVLVNNIEDCYTTLSIVHSQWSHVPHEFDDYIATPKPNGYKSIHTVVISPEGKNVEIQIRTQKMHEESELGVAAHWVYKEGGQEDNYQRKIAWLRQLLDWQREVVDSSAIPEDISQGINENRIYVFAPDGAVVSLPKGATPLDFAYYIHTEVGHKCRGAKVNDRMVPLTHLLKLGDTVDILTAKETNPSRDWLNPQLGYLISSRAKAKIHSWFKKRDYEQNLQDGQTIFQRELKRFNLTGIDVNMLSARFYLNNGNDVLAAIGCGDIRIPQLTGALQDLLNQQTSSEEQLPTIIKTTKHHLKIPKGILVDGVDDLLTSIGHCCKPLPGEAIVGYITIGRGITIHRANCTNITQVQQRHPERITSASWGDVSKQNYAVDLLLEAHNRSDLLRDITRIISDENITIIGLNSYNDKRHNLTIVNVSLEITGQEQLNLIQNRLKNIEDIISLERQ